MWNVWRTVAHEAVGAFSRQEEQQVVRGMRDLQLFYGRGAAQANRVNEKALKKETDKSRDQKQLEMPSEAFRRSSHIEHSSVRYTTISRAILIRTTN